MLPSVKQLRYICAVAEYKHFSKAAEARHVTQSTLSAAIQELESQLGVVIFERNKRLFSLRRWAKSLHQARLILGNVEDFVGLAKSHDEALTGEIRSGVIPTIGPFMLRTAACAVAASLSEAQTFSQRGSQCEHSAAIAGRKLDLAILAFPYPMPDMETLTLFRDDFVLCRRPDTSLRAVNWSSRNSCTVKACCAGGVVTACATMRLKHASCRVLQPMWSIRAPVCTRSFRWSRMAWCDVAARHFCRSRCVGGHRSADQRIRQRECVQKDRHGLAKISTCAAKSICCCLNSSKPTPRARSRSASWPAGQPQRGHRSALL